MLVKGSLIVAILAGLGILAISHFQVAEKIGTLKTDLSSTQEQLTASQAEATTAKKDAKDSKDLAQKTARELAETAANLEGMTSKAGMLETRAVTAETQLTTTSSNLATTVRELAGWKALGLPSEQISVLLKEHKEATNAISALEEEKGVMSKKIGTLNARLAKYEGGKEPPPALPATLRGKVISVDRKWDFVVLDIGSNNQVVERGEMLISRDGRLVAKIRITTVEANRAVANVLTAWKQGDVEVGDVALPSS
jgi:hypothetical protein